MIKLTLVLALITFIAALGLGFVYQSAAPKIEEQRRITEEAARRTALPEAACGVFVRKDTDGFTYYEGYTRADTTGFVGYVVKASGRGYSSTIETMVGVDPGGKVAGLKVIFQQETPGLGTKIEEVKSTKTVLDAIRELVGEGEPARVSVALTPAGGRTVLTLWEVLRGETQGDDVPCLEVALKDQPLCGELEQMVVGGDTAAVLACAPRALGLEAADSAAVFRDTGLTFELAGKVIDKLREQVTPWFLKQFVGAVPSSGTTRIIACRRTFSGA